MTNGWISSVNCEAPSIQCLQPTSTHSTERSPLLGVKEISGNNNNISVSVVTKIWVSFLSVFLVTGVVIGGYLLVKEEYWNATDDLVVISRDNWQAMYLNGSIPSLKHPIRKVRLVQTSTPPCYTEEECSKLVLNMQIEHIHVLKQPDIMYNFLVSSNGVVYEGRGWNYVCDYDDTLTIAIFGAVKDNFLDPEQEEGLKNLIELAIAKKLLVSCYDILVKYDPQIGVGRLVDKAFAIQKINKEVRNCV